MSLKGGSVEPVFLISIYGNGAHDVDVELDVCPMLSTQMFIFIIIITLDVCPMLSIHSSSSSHRHTGCMPDVKHTFIFIIIIIITDTL
jgi:hypothetical protein